MIRIIQCSRNHNHFYSDHSNNCPWCETCHKDGIDYFPPSLVKIGSQVIIDQNSIYQKKEINKEEISDEKKPVDNVPNIPKTTKRNKNVGYLPLFFLLLMGIGIILVIGMISNSPIGTNSEMANITIQPVKDIVLPTTNISETKNGEEVAKNENAPLTNTKDQNENIQPDQTKINVETSLSKLPYTYTVEILNQSPPNPFLEGNEEATLDVKIEVVPPGDGGNPMPENCVFRTDLDNPEWKYSISVDDIHSSEKEVKSKSFSIPEQNFPGDGNIVVFAHLEGKTPILDNNAQISLISIQRELNNGQILDTIKEIKIQVKGNVLSINLENTSPEKYVRIISEHGGSEAPLIAPFSLDTNVVNPEKILWTFDNTTISGKRKIEPLFSDPGDYLVQVQLNSGDEIYSANYSLHVKPRSDGERRV